MSFLKSRRGLASFVLALSLMGLALGLAFREAFVAGNVAFNNDGPMGAIQAFADDSGGVASGFWQNLNWVGSKELGASPNLMRLVFVLIGPRFLGDAGVVLFAKLFPPVALLILGLSAWFLLRQLKFQPFVCALGGVAAALNSNALSYACWGLPSKALTMASTLLAIAVLQGDRSGWRGWVRHALAGFAVGLGVMDGADVGAILSLYVAAYVAFESWYEPGPVGTRVLRGGARLALVAGCAVFIATHSLSTLVGTQIQGVAGMAQDARTRAQQWDAATGWSYPKLEVVRFLVPGIFGYRMDSPDGGAYWGSVGSEGSPPRFSGSGEYAGLLVLVGAVWVGLRIWSRKGTSPFSSPERRQVLFWSVAAVVSLLLAFGRYAPFYRMVYSLPYFSTVRIPMKFLHPFALCLVVLFGYALQAWWRQYLEPSVRKQATLSEHLAVWWRSVGGFDRVWSRLLVAAIVFGVLGAIFYSGSRASLLTALKAAPPMVDTVEMVVGASIREVWISVGLLVLVGAGWLLLASGWFHGDRSRQAIGFLGAVLIVDLLRANAPWVIYYDYRLRYQSNAVIDHLRQKPSEYRVTSFVDPRRAGLLAGGPGNEAWPYLQKLWLENHFQYFRIQSLDLIQAPRLPVLDGEYINHFNPTSAETYRHAARRWELTGTRYLLTSRGMEAQLNQAFDPERRRFREVMPFAFIPRPGAPPDLGRTLEAKLDNFMAVVSTNGTMALLEFTGALPRAKLYHQWQTLPDNEATLARLRDSDFDPQQSVVLTGEDPGKPPGVGEGEVTVVRYTAKAIELSAKTSAAAVLLLNERWHPDWQVTVDGTPAKLLRANHLMRGVAVAAGEHRIVFRFVPPANTIYVSFAAIGIGLGLSGLLIADSAKARSRPTPKV